MRRTRIGIAAVLLGVGLGGLLDGIVLHQIARWHNMLSGRLPPTTMQAMETNMVADGWFHLLVWLVTLAGVAVLFTAIQAPGRTPSPRAFVGNLLVGWGGFNLAEGTVNHFVLGLHHVRDLPTHIPLYDWVFLLAGGVGVLLLGLALRDAPDPGPVGERRSGYDRRSGIPV